MSIQYTFSLRAETKEGKYFYFTVSDAPVFVTEDTIALMGAPSTPLLNANTVAMGYENRYFVGDVLNDEYLVRYRDGFYLLHLPTETHYNINTLTTFTVTKSHVKLDGDSNINLRFKYRNAVFKLNDILGFKDKYLILKHSKLIVPRENISTDAISSLDGERLFFSKSSGICLYEGDICRVTNKQIEILKGERNGKNCDRYGR